MYNAIFVHSTAHVKRITIKKKTTTNKHDLIMSNTHLLTEKSTRINHARRHAARTLVCHYSNQVNIYKTKIIDVLSVDRQNRKLCAIAARLRHSIIFYWIEIKHFTTSIIFKEKRASLQARASVLSFSDRPICLCCDDNIIVVLSVGRPARDSCVFNWFNRLTMTILFVCGRGATGLL